MTERTIYEIHINVKTDEPGNKAIMYTSGAKYGTQELAYKYLEDMHNTAEKSPYIEMNKLTKRLIHQKFKYPDNTTDVIAFIKPVSLMEE